MKVETRYIYPPIPIRTHDWMAFFPDMEEDGPTGYGETEADAIRDLADAAGDLWACCEAELGKYEMAGRDEASLDKYAADCEAEARYELAERERMDRQEVRAEMNRSER